MASDTASNDEETLSNGVMDDGDIVLSDNAERLVARSMSEVSDKADMDVDTPKGSGSESNTKMEALTVDGKKGLKVLFLSSDTGGGHRASAESLAKQFELLYPGTVYVLHDMVLNEGTPPYNSLVKTYKHLSAHPSQWKIVYGVSNSRAFEMIADVHLKLMCERAVRRRIMSYDPDVVISVHPLMTNVPVLSCAKISHKTGKHLPMFTVVTDLGSAHCLWFANGVEKMFIGSEQIRELAKARGKVPDEKLVMAGLPIRLEFAEQAEKLGERMSPEGKAYQQQIRMDLELPFVDRKTILVMGGGEGVGSLSKIVNSLFVDLVTNGIDAVILVVCGRNEKLKKDLENRDWDEILRRHHLLQENRLLDPSTVCGGTIFPSQAGCIKEGVVTKHLRKILSSSSISLDSPVSVPIPTQTRLADDAETLEAVEVMDVASPHDRTEIDEAVSTGEKEVVESGSGEVTQVEVETAVAHPTEPVESKPIEEKQFGHVAVVGLGFMTRMAEYMVAADVLVSKAGPGTISEAASLSLPVMLTSFLPGQEEGNVDYVIDGGFGAFCSDSDPGGIADQVTAWLQDDAKMAALSDAAKAKGAPHAARDIAKAIGDSTLKWREINEEREAARAAAAATGTA